MGSFPTLDTMIFTAIGIVGMVVILACFIANELNLIDRHSIIYNTGNVLGSVILFAYSYEIQSWPFLILNTVWGLVALRDLSNTLAGRAKNR